MKNRNLLGLTFGLVLLAVVVGLWLAPQATAIGPKQEEYVGSLGILIDESVRTTVVNPGDLASGTDQAEVTLTISDLANNTIFQSTVPVGPGGFEYPDLNATQLSQVSFDSSGRAQLIVHVVGRLPGGGCIVPFVEIYDSQTGRTTLTPTAVKVNPKS